MNPLAAPICGECNHRCNRPCACDLSEGETAARSTEALWMQEWKDEGRADVENYLSVTVELLPEPVLTELDVEAVTQRGVPPTTHQEGCRKGLSGTHLCKWEVQEHRDWGVRSQQTPGHATANRNAHGESKDKSTGHACSFGKNFWYQSHRPLHARHKLGVDTALDPRSCWTRTAAIRM